MWAGDFDEELATLASQTLAGPAQPWHKYLDAEGCDAGERTALQEQWQKYVVAVLAKPKALGESRIAAGIVEYAPAC